MAGALADPRLELNTSGFALATSDDWQTRPNGSEVGLIQNAGLAPGNARECVVYYPLTPSAYTAIVRGAPGQTGVALVEIYEVE